MEADLLTHFSEDFAPRSSQSDGYVQLMGREFQRRYDVGRDVWTGEPAMAHLVPLLKDRLAPHSLVLDVGAGRGRDAEVLLALGHRVVAVDLVELPEWREITARWGDRVAYHVGDITDVPLAPGFHAVVDNGVLHHQQPDAYGRYLGRLRDLLAPGGLLAISLFTDVEQGEAGELHRDDSGRLSRSFTDAEADALLSGSGFTVVARCRVPRGLPGRAYQLLIAQAPGS